MPKFVKQYNDPLQLLLIRNGQRQRYYQKTAKYPKREWNPEEDEMVLNSSLKDTELSGILQRSVESIQVRRCRLQKEKSK